MRSSLAYRLIAAVMLFTVLLTVIVTALRLYEDYEHKLDTVNDDIRNIELVTLPGLSSQLWMMDTEQLNISMSGLLHTPYMEQVSVQSGSQILAFAGTLHSRKLIHRDIPILYTHGMTPATIGVLHIDFSRDRIIEDVLRSAYSHLFYQGVEIFLIVLFILIIVRLMITRHLSAMAVHVTKLQSGKLDEVLTLQGRDAGGEYRDELGQVTAALNGMSQKLKHSFDQLRLNEERLEALLKISQMKMTTEEEFTNYALEEGVRLTASKVGYLHFVNDDGRTLGLHLWTQEVHRICGAKTTLHYPLERAGIWADSARLKKPVVHNDYQDVQEKKGYPEGHFPIIRHMSVPIMDADKVVAIAGVGNKDDLYNESDVLQLNIFMNSMWALLKEKRFEVALKESERSYRTLADNLPGLVYRSFLDTPGRIVFFNSMTEQIAGLQPHELAHGAVYPFMHLMPSPDQQRIQDEIAKALQQKRPFSLEYDILHRDGSIRHLSEQGAAVMGQDGSPAFIDGVIFDVTEQRNAQDRLQKSQEFIRNILDTVDEGFIVINTDYTILSANKAYCAQVGLTAENVIGRHCYEVSHGTTRPCHELHHECAARNTFRSGVPSTSLHEHVGKDGQFIYIDAKTFPLKDEHGKVVSVIEVVNNITEKRKLEEQLRQSQKMEAVGLLAGGVAHDFNNILSVIIGYSSLLSMKIRSDNPLSPHVEQILAASARASNLTQSLLAFSRKQLISPRPVNVNDIVRNLEKLLKRVISEDIELLSVMHDRPLTIMADSGQIDQIMINLATNARDAMKNGGRLMIETGPMRIDRQFILANGFGTEGEYACLSMTDTGIGMNEQTKARIFEPFFTTKEPGRGTGLGLAMVYGAVKQNNGHIDVSSEPGKGTSIKIYLPLLNVDADRKVQIVDEVRARRGTETVLIAEDEGTLRKLTSAALREFGYTTIEAKDGEDALSKFHENRDAIKMLIMDVVMPKKSGKAVYDEARRSNPAVKALFVSGYATDILQSKGILDEGINFLPKPVTPVRLAQKIREILDEGPANA